METKEFVSLVRDEVGTAVTRQRILEMTDRAQLEILGELTDATRVKPDPWIATTDGTYSYAASSVLYDASDGTQGDLIGDIRTIKKIYSFDNSVSIFDQQTLDPASDRPNQVLMRPTTDEVSSVITVVPSTKPNSSDCTVKWWEGNNPGTTTVVWRCEAYKWPALLTSQKIDLTVPWDFHDTLLFYAVLRRVKRSAYGRTLDAFDKYQHFLKKFRDRYNRNTSMDIKVANLRDF